MSEDQDDQEIPRFKQPRWLRELIPDEADVDIPQPRDRNDPQVKALQGSGFNPQTARRQLFGGDAKDTPQHIGMGDEKIEALVEKFMQAGPQPKPQSWRQFMTPGTNPPDPKLSAEETAQLEERFRSFLAEIGGGVKVGSDKPPVPNEVPEEGKSLWRQSMDWRANRPAMQKRKNIQREDFSLNMDRSQKEREKRWSGKPQDFPGIYHEGGNPMWEPDQWQHEGKD